MNRGLYPAPEEGSATESVPAHTLGRADAPRECPFCGGKAELRIDNLYNIVIQCHKCYCLVTGFALRVHAVEAWNRRDGEAARIAEAVAQERNRILRALAEETNDTDYLWDRAIETAMEIVANEDTP
jgi:ribosomal protein L37AE/L43A